MRLQRISKIKPVSPVNLVSLVSLVNKSGSLPENLIKRYTIDRGQF